jgi:hypothetical protein
MTQNNWEKRYKKEWQSWFNEMEAYGSFEMMRDFISQLLKSQREEIILDIIEKLPKENPIINGNEILVREKIIQEIKKLIK